MLHLLTDREKEVMELACKNKSNVEIADLVGMTEHTIKKDLHSIYVKLGINSDDPAEAHRVRRKLVMYAKEQGLTVEMEEKENSVCLPSDRKFSIAEIRRVAKELFPDQRIRVVNELLSTLNILE